MILSKADNIIIYLFRKSEICFSPEFSLQNFYLYSATCSPDLRDHNLFHFVCNKYAKNYQKVQQVIFK